MLKKKGLEENSVPSEVFVSLKKERAYMEDKILEFLHKYPAEGHSVYGLMKEFECSYSNVYYVLMRLEKKGTVEYGYKGRRKFWRLKERLADD